MDHSDTQISLTSSLEELNIPHLHVVLDEIFGIPNPSWFGSSEHLPAKVEDLVAMSQLTQDLVISRLKGVINMSENIEISCLELSKELSKPEEHGLILLDVRQDWEYDLARLEGSLLFSKLDMAKFVVECKEKNLEIITICHHGVRSFSAAMYLKQQGLNKVRSLSGGLDRWAIEIDETMKRY